MFSANQLVTVILAGFAMAAVGAPVPDDRTLGRPPLCEASAAVILPCPDARGDCLVVGDNEVKDRLFSFPIRHGDVIADAQGNFKFPGGGDHEVADIEALVSLDAGDLLVMGSHSRDSTCEAKDKRRRFMVISHANGHPVAARKVVSPPIDCRTLLGTMTGTDPIVAAVCKTIDEAERLAGQVAGAGTKADCENAGPFNAEGAMALPGPTETKVWIGLRSPLLATYPSDPKRRDLAILLRLKDLKSFTIDRIALLDLNGRGVRELTVAGDEVWVIAGPSDDRDEPFQLRHFSAQALADNAIIDTRLARQLPSSSEGLAILGRRAYVTIDGEESKKDPHSCQKPAGFFMFDLQSTR